MAGGVDNEFQKYFVPLQVYHDHIYCNNASGSQTPFQVINNIVDYIQLSQVELDCVNHIGDEANRRCNLARTFVDTLFNNINGKIEFCSSTSQLVRNLSVRLDDDSSVYDNVILCECLHYSMIAPFEHKSKNIKWWKHRELYVFDYSDLITLITKDTSLVIIPHVSNITGVLFDIKYIIYKIRAINTIAIIIVDGVSYLPHDMIDVYDWDVDYYFASFSKFLGPHIAAVYIKNHNNKDNLGSFSNEHLVGLLGIQEYMLATTQMKLLSRDCVEIFYKKIRCIEDKLIEKFDKCFEKMKMFQLVTDTSVLFKRFPIFSLINVHKNNDAAKMNLFLNELGIMSSCGQFHCNKFLKEGVLRISLLHYNTQHEIHRIFEELEEFNKSVILRSSLFSSIFESAIKKLFSLHHIELTDNFKELYNEHSFDTNNIRRIWYSLLHLKDMKLITSKLYKSNDDLSSSSIIQYITNSIIKCTPITILNDPCFIDFVKIFKNLVYERSGLECKYCTVHQIRVEVRNDYITPINNDNLANGTYVAMLCVNRVNIYGGINKIYALEDDNNDILYSKTLYEGDFIFCNYRKLKHYVTSIQRSNSKKIARTDILVITSLF